MDTGFGVGVTDCDEGRVVGDDDGGGKGGRVRNVKA